MKIFLLGATGRVGQGILKKALEDNHRVAVLVRSPEKVEIESGNLIIMQGDALNEEDMVEAMAGADIVISALNTDKNDTLSRSMPLIIGAMKQHSISRIVTIGTAGILCSRVEPGLYRFQSSESKRRTTKAAEDHLAAYQCLADSELDWTVVCPTFLPDSEATGTYRTKRDVLPPEGKQVSVGDTAQFAYSELFQENFVHSRVGLAY